MGDGFSPNAEAFIIGDHVAQADNPRTGVGGATHVGILREINPSTGFPSDYLIGFLEKANFVPRRFKDGSVGLTGPRNTGESVVFSIALNTHPGKDRTTSSLTEPNASNNLATPVVRVDKLKGSKLEGAGLVTDVIQVVSEKATVVIKDDDPLAGHVSFYPSRSPRDGEQGVVDVKWRDTLTNLLVPSGSFTNIIATVDRVTGSSDSFSLLSMTSDARLARFNAGNSAEQVEIVTQLQAAIDSGVAGSTALEAEFRRLEARLSPGERNRVNSARAAARESALIAQESAELQQQLGGRVSVVADGQSGYLIKHVDASGEISFYELVPQSGGGATLRRVDERAFIAGTVGADRFGEDEIRFGYGSDDWIGTALLNGQEPTFDASGRLIINASGGNNRTLRASISGVPPTSPGEATVGAARAQAELDKLLDLKAAGDPVMNGPEGDRLIRNQQIAIQAYNEAALASTAPLADGSGRNPIATAFNEAIARLLGPEEAPPYDAKVLGLLASTAIGVTEGSKGDPTAYDEIGGAVDANNVKKKITLSEEGEWLIGHMTRSLGGFWRPIVPHPRGVGMLPPDEQPPPPPPPKEDPIGQIPNPWPREKEKDTPPPEEKARKCGELDLGSPDDKPKMGEGTEHNDEGDGLATCDRETPGGLQFPSVAATLKPRPGTKYNRAQPGAGKSAIQPRRPMSYQGDVDQRDRLGAGVRYRDRANPEPLVPAGGIPLIDPFDFNPKTTAEEAITFLADKLNQALSIINGMAVYSTDATRTRALHLPNQIAPPQEKFFDVGDVAIVDGKPHVLTKNGKRREWSPLTQDVVNERVIGDGKFVGDIGWTFRVDGLLPEVMPSFRFSPKEDAFVLRNAPLVLDGELILPSGEDASENEISTTEAGVLSFKGRVNGTEITRALRAQAGTIAFTSEIPSVSGTTDILPKFTGGTSLGDSKHKALSTGSYGDRISYNPTTDLWEKTHNAYFRPTVTFQFRSAAGELECFPWASNRTPASGSQITDLTGKGWGGVRLTAEGPSSGVIGFAHAYYADNAYDARLVVPAPTATSFAAINFRLKSAAATGDKGAFYVGFTDTVWEDVTATPYELPTDGAYFAFDPYNLGANVWCCVAEGGVWVKYDTGIPYDAAAFKDYTIVLDAVRGYSAFLIDGVEVQLFSEMPQGDMTVAMAALSLESTVGIEVDVAHATLQMSGAE